MKCQSCNTGKNVSRVVINITVHMEDGTTRQDKYVGKQCPACRIRTLQKLRSTGAKVEVEAK